MLRCLLAAVTLILLAVGPVQAHSLSVAHVDISVPGKHSTVRVEVDLAIRDIALSLPLDANRDEQVTWGELRRIRAPLERFVLSGLSLSTDAGACTLLPSGLAIRHYDDGAYATLQLDARCPTQKGWRLRYDLLFEHDPQHRALITLRQIGSVSTAIASADVRDVALGTARSRPFLGFLREGVHHILVGYDHLAFLLSLLLPAALVRLRDDWQPAPDFRRGFTHVLSIVTAFTLAHSITLSLAALGWVRPASRWVEASIAASVLLAALNNVRPIVTQRVWAVGFGFGLVHGFGFAGALGELGLPQGTRLLSLLGFNLGVEIGQLAVVCALLPVLFLLRLHRWYSRAVMPLVSLGIGAVAVSWVWQRLSG